MANFWGLCNRQFLVNVAIVPALMKGLKDYSIVYTEDDQIIVKGSLKNTENLLGEKKLVRVHKSYLVAVDRVKTVQHTQVILGKHSIAIGRSYKKELYETLNLPLKYNY